MAARQIRDEHKVTSSCCGCFSMPRFFYNIKDKTKRLNKKERKAWGSLKGAYYAQLRKVDKAKRKAETAKEHHRDFIDTQRCKWRLFRTKTTNLRDKVNALLKTRKRRVVRSPVIASVAKQSPSHNHIKPQEIASLRSQ